MILTILFFIVVGIYLMGLVGRLALGYWLRKKQREFAESGQARGYSRNYTWGGRKASRSRAEGDVTVQQTQASPRKKINKNVGDYVDYEEIKE